MAEDQQLPTDGEPAPPPPRPAQDAPQPPGGEWRGAPSGPGGSAPTVEQPERKLVRSRKHRVVGGVCGGLGRHFDVDPIVFRVTLGVLSVLGGLGLIAYGFAWLLVPAEGERENEGRRLLSGRVEGTSLTAILIALVGCGMFLASIGSNSSPVSLAVAASVIGAAYWSRRRRTTETLTEGAPHHPAAAQTVADAPPETQAPPVPSMPSWWRDPLAKDDDGRRGTGYLWGPDEEGLTDLTEEKGRPGGFAPHPGRAKDRQSLGGPVFLVACLAAVLGTAATWADQPLGSSLAVGFGSALAVFGLGLVVSAFVGRAGIGTIAAIVVTAVLLAGASVLPNDISTDWDERHWAPTSAAELQDRYQLGTGRGVLDLTELRLRDGQTVRVEVRVGAGELKALVPLDARVKVHVKVGLGSYGLPGGAGSDSGGGVDRSQRRTLEPANGEKARGTIEVELDVGIGDASLVQSLPGAPGAPGVDQGPDAGSVQEKEKEGASL
ncbi:PspC domain-containing protein [Streptomyces sp. N2-109]|uniref:PspC domain-containing protein n=1 Tax=Streptomyces gossypii TaxID=2883101 RepID=A0ABT2JX82_9ACTN|nr:PspC domain-containing protein [Streptomyces gossypii]MCT2592331.1 PspC domain-containing protein [Streptomyces gossypii]